MGGYEYTTGGVYTDFGTISMSGGSISNNHSCGNRGGGIQLENKEALLKLSGGKITGNTVNMAGEGGAGVCVWINGSRIELSGSPEVVDNKVSDGQNNIYITSSDKVSVTDRLTGSAESIGVTLKDGPGVFTGSTGTANNDPTKFVSDNSDYAVGKYPAAAAKNAGQLFLGTSVIVTFDANGHGTAPGAQTVASGAVVRSLACWCQANLTITLACSSDVSEVHSEVKR